MSIDVRIADAQGGKTATVKHPDQQQDTESIHALCVNISGMDRTSEFAIPVTQGVFGTPFDKELLNGSSREMAIDGSVTPVVFQVDPDPIDVLIVSEFFIYGNDGSIKFSNFLGRAALPNGVLIEIKATNTLFTFAPIKTTGELLAFSSSNSFSFYQDTSADALKAVREQPFALQPAGTYGAGNDDYVRVTIRDDLTTLNEMFSGLRGVKRVKESE